MARQLKSVVTTDSSHQLLPCVPRHTLGIVIHGGGGVEQVTGGIRKSIDRVTPYHTPKNNIAIAGAAHSTSLTFGHNINLTQLPCLFSSSSPSWLVLRSMRRRRRFMFGRNQILLTWGSHISEHSPSPCARPPSWAYSNTYLHVLPSFLPCTPSAVAVCLFLELFLILLLLKSGPSTFTFHVPNLVVSAITLFYVLPLCSSAPFKLLCLLSIHGRALISLNMMSKWNNNSSYVKRVN